MTQAEDQLPRPNVALDRKISALLATVIAFAGARSVSPFSGLAPHIDSGVYLLAGRHLLHGRLLYRDVWDHKPPLIHLINAAALALGDGTINAVRNIEGVLGAAIGLTAFLTLFSVFRRTGPAVFGSGLLLVLFYNPAVFRGNQPEEYASFLALVGIASAVMAIRSTGRVSVFFVFLSGLGFGLASTTKETFAAGAIPLVLWMVLLALPDRRRALFRLSAFALGACTPWLVFSLWLSVHGLWPQWREILAFNLHYIQFDDRGALNPDFLTCLWRTVQKAWVLVLSVSKTALALAVAGLAGLAHTRFQRETRWFSAAVAGFFLVSLAATSQGRRYDYYFLQLVGGWALLAGCGLAFLLFMSAELLERGSDPGRAVRTFRSMVTQPQAIVLIAVAVAMPVLDGGQVGRFARGLVTPWSRFGDGDATVAFLKAHTREGDSVWNLIRDRAWVCAHADRLSPTRFFYISAHLFRDLPDPPAARSEIHNALMADPPVVVLFDGNNTWLDSIGIRDWFRSHYALSAQRGVYVRQADAKPLLPVAGGARTRPPV